MNHEWWIVCNMCCSPRGHIFFGFAVPHHSWHRLTPPTIVVSMLGQKSTIYYISYYVLQGVKWCHSIPTILKNLIKVPHFGAKNFTAKKKWKFGPVFGVIFKKSGVMCVPKVYHLLNKLLYKIWCQSGVIAFQISKKIPWRTMLVSAGFRGASVMSY